MNSINNWFNNFVRNFESDRTYFKRLFFEYCKNGDLKNAKKYYDKIVLTFFTLLSTHLNFAYLLPELNDETFIIACSNNKVNIASWIYRKRITDKYLLKGFEIALLQENFSVFNWFLHDHSILIKLIRISISINDIFIFNFIIDYCFDNNIWIVLVKAFNICCYTKKLEMANSIYQRLSNYPEINTIIADIIMKFRLSRDTNSNIYKWLHSLGDENFILQNLYNPEKYDEIIQKLNIPSKKNTNSDVIITEKCSICLEKYNFISSCNHYYCLKCFLTYNIKYKNNNCSYCRQIFDLQKCCFIKN